MGDQRHEHNFNRFLNCVILLSAHTGRFDQNTKPHNLPTDCTKDSTAVIPQTRDLADSLVIKRDFSRDTNMEDLQRRQLAVLACVVLNKDGKGLNIPVARNCAHTRCSTERH